MQLSWVTQKVLWKFKFKDRIWLKTSGECAGILSFLSSMLFFFLGIGPHEIEKYSSLGFRIFAITFQTFLSLVLIWIFSRSRLEGISPFEHLFHCQVILAYLFYLILFESPIQNLFPFSVSKDRALMTTNLHIVVFKLRNGGLCSQLISLTETTPLGYLPDLSFQFYVPCTYILLDDVHL